MKTIATGLKPSTWPPSPTHTSPTHKFSIGQDSLLPLSPFFSPLPPPSLPAPPLISYCQIQLHGPSFLLKRIRTAKGALKFGEKDKVSFLLKLFCKKKLFVQLKNSKDLCTCAQNIKTPEGRKL